MPDRSDGGFIEERSLDLSLAEKSGELPSGRSLRDVSSGEKADEYRKWDERGREWLYGFVWFEQRRDKGIARGYMQVSS